MLAEEYYSDLLNQQRVTSAYGIKEEKRRIERIEKGRTQACVEAITNSPLFVELKTQTELAKITIAHQKKQIEELQSQNGKLDQQIQKLEKANSDSERQAKISNIVAVVSIIIALASFIASVVSFGV